MGEWLTITISTVSLVFSCVSTVIAGITAFYAFVRRPRVQMTRPTFVALAFEGREASPKVFTRTLLFATAAPGKVVEAMFARVRQGNQEATYTFWAYDVDGRLVPGGGLFVGPQGIVTNHHFVLAKNSNKPEFSSGPVTITVFARVVGERKVCQLHEMVLSFTENQAVALNGGTGGVFFERSPDSNEFHRVVDLPPGVRGGAEPVAAPDRGRHAIVGGVQTSSAGPGR